MSVQWIYRIKFDDLNPPVPQALPKLKMDTNRTNKKKGLAIFIYLSYQKLLFSQ